MRRRMVLGFIGLAVLGGCSPVEESALRTPPPSVAQRNRGRNHRRSIDRPDDHDASTGTDHERDRPAASHHEHDATTCRADHDNRASGEPTGFRQLRP